MKRKIEVLIVKSDFRWPEGTYPIFKLEVAFCMLKYDLLNFLFVNDHFRVEKCLSDPENTKLAKSWESLWSIVNL